MNDIKIKMPNANKYVPISKYQIKRIYEDDPGPALLIIMDEIAETLSKSGVKNDAGKQEDALKDEITYIIQSIAALGRSAGVFLVCCTQSAYKTVLPGIIQSNLQNRMVAGPVKGTQSLMALDNLLGTTIPATPKGRGIISVNGESTQLQTYFANPKWIQEWYEDRGLDSNGFAGNEVIDDVELEGMEEVNMPSGISTFEFEDEKVEIPKTTDQSFEEI